MGYIFGGSGSGSAETPDTEADVSGLVADLALKAPLASPTLTGTPSLPTGTTAVTQSAADGSTKLATTLYVDTADNLKANLASPTLTGTPALPTGTTGVTQAGGTSNTRLATTAYVASSSPTIGLARTGALAETFSRMGIAVSASAVVLTSGTLALTAINIPTGTTIGHITFLSGTTALSTGTHQWFGLYDLNLVQLATTTDDTSTAWAASVEKTLAIATIASGASSTFTTTYSGLHYIGCMVAASTVPTLFTYAGVTTLFALAPVLNGNSDTAQTTPPSFAHTATTITPRTNAMWGYVS